MTATTHRFVPGAAMTAAELRAAKRARLTTELARLRFDAGLTIREVVDACGISSTSLLASWEHGVCSPRMPYLLRLAAFYEVPPERLAPGRRFAPWEMRLAQRMTPHAHAVADGERA